MKIDRLQKILSDFEARPIVIMSHERSGTHLNIDLLRKQMKECFVWKWPSQKLSRLYLALESIDNPGAPTPTPSSLAVGVLRRGGVPLFKTHLTLQQIREGSEIFGHPVSPIWTHWLLRRGRFCYVYRDGREVMCSLYLFYDSDPAYSGRSFSEFLRSKDRGLTPPQRWAEHVRQGLLVPDVYPMKWEDVIRQTDEFIQDTARHFDLTPKNVRPLLPRRRNKSFVNSIRGRLAITHESTAIVHRKPSPKWRDIFTPSDVEFFNQETKNLIVELNYESTAGWG